MRWWIIRTWKKEVNHFSTFRTACKGKKHNLPYFLRRINCSDLAHLINFCAKCAKFKACFQVSLTSSCEGYGKSCVQAGVQQPPRCKQGFRKKFLKGVVWNGFFHTFFSLQSLCSKYRTRLEKISHGSKRTSISGLERGPRLELQQ